MRATTTLLCGLGFCAMAVTLAAPRSPQARPRDYGPPPNEPYLDMEKRAWDARSGLQGGLRLRLHPSRFGPYGLNLRLEIWNGTDKEQKVGWPFRAWYVPAFRTPEGRLIDVRYYAPPFDPPLQHEADLVRLEPGYAIAQNLRFATFYLQTAKYPRVQASLHGTTEYLPEGGSDPTATPGLDSGWVDLPPR